MRGGLLLRRDRTCLEEGVRFRDLGIELRLRSAKRIDLRAQRPGPPFEIFGRLRRFLEHPRHAGDIDGGAVLLNAASPALPTSSNARLTSSFPVTPMRIETLRSLKAQGPCDRRGR